MNERTEDQVRRARVAAQLLHRPGRRPAVADLVARLLAVQAQDISAVPLAIRARSRGLTAGDVAAAREDRSVVRAWGPRGTLHLVAAADLGLLLALAPPAGSVRRLRQEGITGEPSRLVRACERALAGQGPLSKEEVAARLRLPVSQGVVHILAMTAARGTVVLGPDQGRRPTYVHTADWLGHPIRPEPDRDRALAELARRYLRAHAPAAPEDLAAWSGLPLRDAEAGWRAVADELTEVRLRGRALWQPRRGAPRPVEVPVVLVPAFDEYLLGWRDRELIAPGPLARRVFRGGGMITAAVLVDGRVAGSWRRERGGVVTDIPGGAGQRGAAGGAGQRGAGGPIDADALATEIADVARF